MVHNSCATGFRIISILTWTHFFQYNWSTNKNIKFNWYYGNASTRKLTEKNGNFFKMKFFEAFSVFSKFFANSSNLFFRVIFVFSIRFSEF